MPQLQNLLILEDNPPDFLALLSLGSQHSNYLVGICNVQGIRDLKETETAPGHKGVSCIIMWILKYSQEKTLKVTLGKVCL